MAIGKSGIIFDLEKLSIKFGNFNVIQNGKLYSNYNETEIAVYERL